MFSTVKSLFRRTKSRAKVSTHGSRTNKIAHKAALSVEGLEQRLVMSGNPINMPIVNPDYFQVTTSSTKVAAGTKVSVTITECASATGKAVSAGGTVNLSTVLNGVVTSLGAVQLSGGVARTTVTLDTAGMVDISAIELPVGTGHTLITGSNEVSVTPGAVTSFSVTAPSTVLVGNAFNVTVTARDKYGNVATGTNESVNLTSTDGQALSPNSVKLVNGVGTVSLTLETADKTTIVATCGSVTGRSSMTITPDWFSMNILDQGLQTLARTDFKRDGSITYSDMLGLFAKAEAEYSTVTGGEMVSLMGIVDGAAYLKMTPSLANLANKVVNGDPGNATFEILSATGVVSSVPLGNLQVGCTSGHLAELVDKWLLGENCPLTKVESFPTAPVGQQWVNPSYQMASDTIPLFANGVPQYTNIQQGEVGDCWLMAALAETAARDVSAIQSMFTSVQKDSHGNTTVWAVRFFINGAADYVTVDDNLPDVGAQFASTKGGLWVALAEKAYAQECGSGKIGSDPSGDSFASINGGFSSWAFLAITNVASTSPSVTQSSLSSAWNSGQLLTLSTPGLPASATKPVTLNGANVVSDHEYCVVAYNASTQQYTLYNPWGTSTSGEVLPNGKTSAACALTVVGTASQLVTTFNSATADVAAVATTSKNVASEVQSPAMVEQTSVAPGAMTAVSHTDVVFSNLVPLSQGMVIMPLKLDHVDTAFADMGSPSKESSMSELSDPVLANDYWTM